MKLRQSRVDFGIPQTVYSDNHTIFHALKQEKAHRGGTDCREDWVHLAQFERPIHELRIDLFAKTLPQAKGH